MGIRHAKISTIQQTGDPSLVGPGDWNADHTISGVTLDLSGAGTTIVNNLQVNGVITGGGSIAGGPVAAVNLTAQASSIAPTTLYTVANGLNGIYMVHVDLICTQSGSGGTVSANISWNNGTTAAGLTTPNLSLTTQGEMNSQIGSFNSAASQNITYSTTVTGATGGPSYSLRIRLVYLT